MKTASPVLRLIVDILAEDPRAAIVIGEILGPPPGLGDVPAKPWEEG
ncbi:hypothetical protein M1O13_02745 [Dehalococcoidia bacterium]|nr:hypothetical protein [Dehalococcoidia bacterium]MCL0090893.1 hypothetical protein [Dehalococcoidia bacterium]MCL0093305.1 hypothetical protein [Dehalococcoidia bacterium]